MKMRKPAAPMMEFFCNASSTQQHFDTVVEEQTVLYGAYIPTLVNKFEAGEFARVSTRIR